MRNSIRFFSAHLLKRLADKGPIALLLIAAFLPLMGVAQATIQVEPNILVSRESPLPKIQMMVVADPKDAKHLVGTAIAATPVEDVCTIYVSFDGGYSWKAVVPPDLPPTGSGDPQVVFSNRGEMFFSTLGLVPDAAGKLHFTVLLYRSRDGGLSWENISGFGAGSGPDHDMAVTDQAGRLFISVVYRISGRENIGVYRLDPGESRMQGPLHVATADAGTGVFNWNLLILPDGTLFVPFIVSRGSLSRSPMREVLASVSHDGGATFSAPIRIGTQTLNPHNPVNPYGMISFAVDQSSSHFQNRIYMVWNQSDGSPEYRLKLAYSNDQGASWSTPHDVDVQPGQHASAFRPVVAVNGGGAVGISWLDTQGSPTGRTYREFFTASLDGGQSFQAPVAVSSVSSSLDEPSNYALHPSIDSPRRGDNGSIEFSFDTTLGNDPDGGDFMGLAADIGGTFHPFWIDTRTGAYQVWTAAVRVGAQRVGASPAQEDADLNQRLRPVFDPAIYEVQTGAETIPVRLKNISHQPVCAPLFAVVEDTDTTPHQTPRILNARNGKDWAGAYFDYSPAFRDLPCLAPGQVTEAVTWKVQPLASERTFVTLNLTLTHLKPKE